LFHHLLQPVLGPALPSHQLAASWLYT